MKINVLKLIPFGVAALFAAPHELLYLEFDDTASMGSQRGLSPIGTVAGDLSAAPGLPRAADLGSTGRVHFPAFAQPRGSFTVEARFRLRSYAPVDTRHISDLVNTAIWVGGFQGFTLRLGGGYLYATPPRAAYATDSQYQSSLGYYGNTENAFYSRCVGEFLTASSQYPVWKEVVTDRCLDLNRWVYLVGTWDGQNLRIYLDGMPATDPWRINGAALQPSLDSAADLYIGARSWESYDSRHTDGWVDFVRILDTSMDPGEIKDRFRNTLDSNERDRCRVKVDPEYPVGGRCVKGNERFRIRKSREGNCGSGGATPDSVDVEFSKSPLFDSVFLSHSTTDTVFQIDSAALTGKDPFSGATYWRCRSRNSGSLAKPGAFAAPEAWSLPAPIMMDFQTNASRIHTLPETKARRIALESGRRLFIPSSLHPSRPRLYGLDGAAANANFVACPAGWCLEPGTTAASGIFLLR